MATQAKMRGYQTLSFSSRLLNMKNTKWFMIEDALTVNFDQIWHQGTTGEPQVNEAAQSDRLMGKHFKSWIDERSQSNETTKTPFFAQFYYFDSHVPFFQGDSNATNRKDGMLETVDKGIEDIFRYLRDAGELDNTIVVAAGDHGEDSRPRGFNRLAKWSPDILHPLMYMYVPNRVSARNPEIMTNLNHNRKQLVSTLDIFPTILRILDGNFTMDGYTPINGDDGCMRGQDLLQKIDSNRVAWSLDEGNKANRGNFAVHYRGSSLVNRFGWPRDNGLKIFTYDKYVGSSVEEKEVGDILNLTGWKSFMEGMIEKASPGTPIVAMKSSTYMERLISDLKECIKKMAV